jgi:transposase
LLPKRRRGAGRPRADDCKTLNGIPHVLKTGCPWEDLPRAYGSPVTCWRRRHWPKRGRPIRPGPSYRDRWKVERCFAWMDNCRRLVVRYEHYVEHYRAFCLLAIILWCLNLILK